MFKEYIVYLKGNVTPAELNDAIKDVENAGGTINHRYTSVLKGFSASMPESHFERLKASSKEVDSNISRIEPAVEMTIGG
ncbi:hypothetical protein FRC12_006544 [Ceratobasidium sp. 428]|nr:hypothetical protein FRC12_006544 [Ceratobasidium sp. 428]